MNIIAIITARGGSKRLPGKNIKMLCGKPMIAYTINEAKKSEYIDEIYVSTEDKEIACISKKYGAEIIERPIELSADDTTTQAAVRHAKLYVGLEDMITVLLQPTSPLRIAEDIDQCIKLYLSNAVDAVASISSTFSYEYKINGAVYVFKDKIYTDKMGFYLMPKNRSVDIDTLEDFEMAKIYMENKK